MRHCDRHPRKTAVDEIHLERSDQRFDLCEQCAAQIEAFISDTKMEAVEEPKKKRGLLGRIQH